MFTLVLKPPADMQAFISDPHSSKPAALEPDCSLADLQPAGLRSSRHSFSLGARHTLRIHI
jgi:hypothetical protein